MIETAPPQSRLSIAAGFRAPARRAGQHPETARRGSRWSQSRLAPSRRCRNQAVRDAAEYGRFKCVETARPGDDDLSVDLVGVLEDGLPHRAGRAHAVRDGAGDQRCAFTREGLGGVSRGLVDFVDRFLWEDGVGDASNRGSGRTQTEAVVRAFLACSEPS